MGSRGPNPRPGSSESERGRNTSSRRTGRNPSETLPKCPGDLSDVAKKFWKTHAKSLHDKGYLSPGDVPAFVRLCSTWSQLGKIDGILDREGLTVTAGSGGMRAHPAAALRTSTEKTFLALACQFGMSPNSRQRVPKAEESKPARMRRDRNAETNPSSFESADDDNEI